MRLFSRRAPGWVVWALWAAGQLAPSSVGAQSSPWLRRTLERFRDPDPAIRRGAIDEIGRFAPPDVTVTSRLHEVLSDPDPTVLLAAVSALASGRMPGSVERLALQIPVVARVPEAQAAACRGLTGPRLSTAVAGINPLDAPPMVVDAAARALSWLSPEAFGRGLNDARPDHARTLLWLRAIALRGDPRWGVFARDLLRTPGGNLYVSIAALETLATLHMVEASRDVADLAQNAPAVALRQAALRAMGSLGTTGDPAVIRAGLAAPITRAAALEACASLGDATLVPDVAGLLQANWIGDRRAAAETLASIGGSAARQALIDRLGQASDDATRADLWHALSRMPEEGGRVATVMLAAARTSSAGRWAALEWAQRGGSLELPDLTQQVHDGEAAAMALAGWAGRYRSAREANLRAGDPDVRLGAALSFALGRETNTDGDALAIQLAREDDESVRVVLLQALARIGGDAARGAVLRLLAYEGDTIQPSIVAALDAVADLRLHDATPWVHRALWSRDEHQRLAAVRAALRLEDTAAYAGLERLVRFDPSATVRGPAALAIAALAGAAAWEPLRDLHRIAWTERLVAQAGEALEITRGVREWTPFEGRSVVRVSGAPPRSIWTMVLPDGSERLAVATGDGELMVAGAPSSTTTLTRLDSPR